MNNQIVSCKPLLVAATRSNSEIVRDFSELQSDALLLGVLRHAMSYGVFVEFPNNIVGLAPKAVSFHAITFYYESTIF